MRRAGPWAEPVSQRGSELDAGQDGFLGVRRDMMARNRNEWREFGG